jgi:hypothetical protein
MISGGAKIKLKLDSKKLAPLKLWGGRNKSEARLKKFGSPKVRGAK